MTQLVEAEQAYIVISLLISLPKKEAKNLWFVQLRFSRSRN